MARRLESSDPTAQAMRQPLRALLAEDNVIAGELLVLIARRLGVTLDWVENGLDAIDSIHRARADGAPYSLLLLDSMMPVLSGPEATRRIRQAGITAAELPIIAVTAATDPVEVREIFAAGMQAYLAKPVSVADLSACLDAWVPQYGRIRRQSGAQALDALRKRYDLRKTEIFAKLDEAVQAPACSPEMRIELRDHLHKLAGTAGSFGEERLSEAAARGAKLLAQVAPEGFERALGDARAMLKAAD